MRLALHCMWGKGCWLMVTCAAGSSRVHRRGFPLTLTEHQNVSCSPFGPRIVRLICSNELLEMRRHLLSSVCLCIVSETFLGVSDGS